MGVWGGVVQEPDGSKLAVLMVWPSGVGPYSLVVQSNPEQEGSGFGGSCFGLNLRHP